MKVINSSETLKGIKFKKPLALVPTMGNLHLGHLSLVEYAKQNFNSVMVSIYVNPLQFGPQEDFKKYPKTLDEDKKVLKEKGCDFLFLPEKDFSDNLNIETTELSKVLCGINRPGHFEGVIAIVNKFLDVVNPDACLFGLKDFQQQLIIKDFVKRKNLKTKIISLPTIREKSGLAMSSRNNYLNEDQKLICGKIYKELCHISETIKGPFFEKSLIEQSVKNLEKSQFKVDYLHILDAESLKSPFKDTKSILIAIAVNFQGVRLIDNVIKDL